MVLQQTFSIKWLLLGCPPSKIWFIIDQQPWWGNIWLSTRCYYYGLSNNYGLSAMYMILCYHDYFGLGATDMIIIIIHAICYDPLDLLGITLWSWFHVYCTCVNCFSSLCLFVTQCHLWQTWRWRIFSPLTGSYYTRKISESYGSYLLLVHVVYCIHHRFIAVVIVCFELYQYYMQWIPQNSITYQIIGQKSSLVS